MTHHGHQCASASKVIEGGKINSPAGWQGLRNLPPWALRVCSTGDQLQISPLHKDATEWLSGLESDPLDPQAHQQTSPRRAWKGISARKTASVGLTPTLPISACAEGKVSRPDTHMETSWPHLLLPYAYIHSHRF